MATRDPLVLRLERTVSAPQSKAWSALADGKLLARWWGPQGFTIPSLDFDPRVGESYRIAMQPPDAEPFHLTGEFKEVDPPSRLAFTFVWDPPDPDDRTTLATLSLEDRGDETRLSLTQDGFATPERVEVHRGGWTDSLERLAALLADPELS